MELLTKQEFEQFRVQLFDYLRKICGDQPSQPKRYLKSDEVMKEFQISATKLYEMRRNGEIPCMKVGGQYLYEYSELIAHFKNNS